ncbi:MAG: fibro-slime domain-containing protein [Planctomycetes bacterium]|nr:fibro-slime domain-containing protein [Planctomycetota bacterium]
MNSRNKAAIFFVAVIIGAGIGMAMFFPATRGQTIAAEPMRPTIHVTGIVRDFHAAHPDFDVVPAAGAGHYAGMVPLRLEAPGADPTFTGGGHKVLTSATDAQGRTIAPHLAAGATSTIGAGGDDACTGRRAGDHTATLDPNPSPVAVTSPGSFDEWLNDVPGTNLSAALDIPLVQQAGGTFVFDNDIDPRFADLGGFYPIDDQLFGNEGNPHNLHFTLHFSARFTYQQGQFLTYVGNSDVWAYVGDRLGIDAGGIHGSLDQRIDLDRLCLQPGAQYWLSFSLAHRDSPVPQLRIETNIEFGATNLASVTNKDD